MPPFEFLGPYRIGETIGRGGMGTVYRAVHEKTGEPVAVKLIAAHVADEPKFRRRFDAEVKTLQRLRHEGIVRLIGFGEEEGQLFYSMELVEGESLQARIRREKRIDWRATLDIAIQVCAALKHAHDIGVIHRDLKPANLILTQNDHVKLVDFGIAKIFGDGEQTMVGSVLGTADFMAPEQATSSGITVRTDLYALGSLMYAMLTGRPPFSGKNTTEVIESLKRDRPVPLDIINPELPGELVELVHHLLEKEPGDRPPTALAVMNRLKAMRAGLQHAATVVNEGSPTEVGPKAKSGENQHRKKDRTQDSASLDVSDEPTLIRASSAIDTSASDDSIARSDERVPDSRTKPTEVSDTRESKTVPPRAAGRVSQKNQTHFQTVSDKDSHTSVFGGHGEGAASWTQWISIAGMLVVLVAGAAMLLQAMRPPSADQLYAAATVEDDTGAKRTFLNRFPDDPRAETVRDALMADRIRGVTNGLAARAKIGVAPLTVVEEQFLAAMLDREQTPRESSERLRQWLKAFEASPELADPKMADMIELAEYEATRLSNADASDFVNPRLSEVIALVDAAEQVEDPDERRTRLEGILELFGGEPWAKPAIDRVRQMLTTIGGGGK